VLLFAAQKLDKPLGEVLAQYEELAAVLVMPDVEAQYLVQIAEDAFLVYRELQFRLIFESKEGSEELDGRMFVEVGKENLLLRVHCLLRARSRLELAVRTLGDEVLRRLAGRVRVEEHFQGL
jgi:hypothetical protein